MKDSYMLLVLLIVMLSPMLPAMLKSKCPVCKKRKLEHLETVNSDASGKSTFITYYLCHNCKQKFEREKSGPLKQSAGCCESQESCDQVLSASS